MEAVPALAAPHGTAGGCRRTGKLHDGTMIPALRADMVLCGQRRTLQQAHPVISRRVLIVRALASSR